MCSHTTPNLPLHKALSVLLQAWEKENSTFSGELKSCLAAPRLRATSLPCCCCLRPWLGSGAVSAPLRFPKTLLCPLQSDPPTPMPVPPTSKSHGGLPAKPERCSGCLDKNAATGPTSQAPLVNAPSTHETSFEPSPGLHNRAAGSEGRSRGNRQQGDAGERRHCQTIPLRSRNWESPQESSSPHKKTRSLSWKFA